MPKRRRLSSAWTVPCRVLVAAVSLGLGGIAIAAVVRDAASVPALAIRLAVALALGWGTLILLATTAFMTVELDGTDLRVTGLWRTWRVSTAQIASAVSSRGPGNMWLSTDIVRVVLCEPLPGLGRDFRFLCRVREMGAVVTAELAVYADIARAGDT